MFVQDALKYEKAYNSENAKTKLKAVQFLEEQLKGLQKKAEREGLSQDEKINWAVFINRFIKIGKLQRNNLNGYKFIKK